MKAFLEMKSPILTRILTHPAHSQDLAVMIGNLSASKPINLIRTETGTEVDGLTPWERLI